VTIAPLGFALALSLNAPVSIGAVSVQQPTIEPTIALSGRVNRVQARASDAVKLFATLNAERRNAGLAPLDLDPQLSAVAEGYAAEMASKGFFSHIGPSGDTPFDRMDRASIKYGYAGENIALDQSVALAGAALFASTDHRANILNVHYLHVGIAAVNSADGEIFVEDFRD